MLQVLFWIPVKWIPIEWLRNFLSVSPNGVPIFGFGLMLFLAFVSCVTVLTWHGKRNGFSKDLLYDLAFWVFIGGIIGARIVYMIQYDVPIGDWYKIWQGGIVFYGSAIGGWAGYGLAWLWLRYGKRVHINTWKLADVVAPVVCVGLAIGRVGCLLNGCCYGHVCPDCGVRFPTLTAPARELVVDRTGYQTAAGFAVDDQNFLEARVGPVEPGSPADKGGLRTGDVIIKANDRPIGELKELRILFFEWQRGQESVALIVKRDGKEMTIPAFTPKTLPLHPTQLYETISMTLLFFLLMAFFPFRRHYGQVFVLLMICYAFHRFFNETLRNDTDPVLANLTLSQVGSIAVLIAAIALGLFLRRFSIKTGGSAAPAPPAKAHAHAGA